MKDEADKPARSVVTIFQRTAGKRTYPWSLIVFEPERDHKGEWQLYQHLYDVEYSKRFGYIFHMSGAGAFPLEIDGLYHVSGDLDGKSVIEKPCQLVDSSDNPPWKGAKTKAIRARNGTRRIRMPKAFSDAPDMLAWLQNNAIQGDAVFCTECRDLFPGDNECDWCEHIWWCDKTGLYSTPNERCKCKSRKECYDR